MPQDNTEYFQQYQILTRPDGTRWVLGQNEMGVTYKALDTELGVTVALKIVNKDFLRDETVRAHFMREARAAATLKHRNIANVHHLNEDPANCFYATEFIDGENLDDLVDRRGPLPVAEALDIISQAAQGLDAAQEKFLIHRGIKPANILLTEEVGGNRIVKLIEFEWAKGFMQNGDSEFASSAFAAGTSAFANPEQINEELFDTRSDIYSLGAVLWFMLTGAPVFSGTDFSIRSQHLSKTPPLERLPADVPANVRALLSRMLAKNRADRPQTQAELLKELAACLTPLKVAASASPETRQPGGAVAASPGQSAPRKGSGAPVDPRAPSGHFTLVEVLRRRGALLDDEAVTLVDLLAPQIDAARQSDDDPFNLEPSLIVVEFAHAPTDLAELPSRPIAEWPEFTLELGHISTAPAAAEADQTMMPGSTLDFASDDPLTALGALVYELLAGQRPRPGRYRPLAGLNEQANVVLRSALQLENRFKSATEFSEAFRAAVIGAGGDLPVAPSPRPKPALARAATPAIAPKPVSSAASVTPPSVAPVTPPPPKPAVTSTPAPSPVTATVTPSPKPVPAPPPPAPKPEPSPLPKPTPKPTPAPPPPLQKLAPPTPIPPTPPTKPRAPLWIAIGSAVLVLALLAPVMAWFLRKAPVKPIPPDPTVETSPSPAPSPGATPKGTPPKLVALPPTPTPTPPASGKEATPKTATKARPYVNSLGMEFVPVPGEKVLFAAMQTRKSDFEAFAQATARDRKEWKNVEVDGVKVSAMDDHPVVMVSWEDAKAFCNWLSQVDSIANSYLVTYRLPTAKEWAAARGKGAYPWGEQWPPPPDAGNFADAAGEAAFRKKKRRLTPIPGYNDNFATTAPVTSFKANPLGLFNLGGNVKEWCQELDDQQRRQVMGASWQDGDMATLTAKTPDAQPKNVPRAPTIGFRCVVDISR
jgi:formylglycine-generating enzyme required for sulfatase activity